MGKFFVSVKITIIRQRNVYPIDVDDTTIPKFIENKVRHVTLLRVKDLIQIKFSNEDL